VAKVRCATTIHQGQPGGLVPPPHTAEEGLAVPVTHEYLESLPAIYRDILAAFPRFDATRKRGYGLSYQSLYSALNGKYTLGEIVLACQELAKGGGAEIKNEIFVHPTLVGEELIAAVTGGQVPQVAVPPFPPLRP
jgi:hypothetical protein